MPVPLVLVAWAASSLSGCGACTGQEGVSGWMSQTIAAGVPDSMVIMFCGEPGEGKPCSEQ